MRLRVIAGLCNGSTPDSDSVCEGSNPSPAAKTGHQFGAQFFCIRPCLQEKGGDAMEIHARLRQLLRERGWPEYKPSRKCGLAQSTIGNLFRRNTRPSLATLAAICSGFGITMSQFFADADMVELTPNLKELFDCWACLTPSQKAAALQMRKAMRCDNDS